MKRFLTTLLLASAFTLSACGATMYSSKGSQSKLESKGYSVEVYPYEEAKVRVDGLNYDTVTFTDALIATKDSGDDKDILLAFYFKSVSDAEKFLSDNNNYNIGQFGAFANKELGKNLKAKMGSHNNVAYIGSETSFKIAF